MAAHLVLLIILSLWTFNLGQCAVATEISEITESSSNSDMNDAQFICSHHFRKFIEGIYKNSFDNFNETIHLSEISDDVNFKADVLLGLCDAMNKAHHTEIPYHAIELYNKIEAFLNVNNTNLHPKTLKELMRIREGLLFSSIVPKGSHILESAAYVKSCSLYGTPVDKLLKILLTTNGTVSNLTFIEMVAKVRWTLPVEELTPILANLSPYIKQNVDILLALYDTGPFQEAEKEIIILKLFKLTKNLDYARMITPETQRKVDAIIPWKVKLQNIFKGPVSFYQELSNGNRGYIHECSNSPRICVYEYEKLEFPASLIPKMQQNPFVFTFSSLGFHRRVLAIQFEESEPLEDKQLDLYSLDEIVDFKWKVQVEGEQVVLQNLNGTKFLCADIKEKGFAYTRNQASFLLHRDECKWFVADWALSFRNTCTHITHNQMISIKTNEA